MSLELMYLKRRYDHWVISRGSYILDQKYLKELENLVFNPEKSIMLSKEDMLELKLIPRKPALRK